MELIKSFNLKNVIFNKENQVLTFQFEDNATRVCIGIHSVEDALREIKRILIQEYCS